MNYEYLLRRVASVTYPTACGVLLYAFIEQVASRQSGPEWISDSLLALAILVGAWNVMERA